MLDADIFSILDRERGLAIYWARSADRVPGYEVAAPLRGIFQWWAADRGIEQVHAAAVGLPDGGVLIAGKPGSGKSNAALACVDSDLYVVGDDFCLIDSKPRPSVFSLYSTAKTAPDDRRRHAFLGGWPSTAMLAGAKKTVYFLQEAAPERLIAGFPLRAILVAEVTDDRESRIGPLTPAAAMVALAPTSLVLAPGSERAAFHRLAALVRTVPCHALRIGTDARQVPRVIHRFLLDHRLLRDHRRQSSVEPAPPVVHHRG
jgi:hypothetical protein